MKTRIFVVFVFIVLTPVLVAVQNQPSGTKNRKDAQQANPTTPISVDCNCAPQADDSKHKPQGWHRFVTWPEGIATWALIFTLGAIAWQSIETRRATNSQRDKERARLSVEMSNVGGNIYLQHLQRVDPFDWIAEIKITQHGPTKAFNVVGYATVVVKPIHEARPTVPLKKMIRMRDLSDRIAGEPIAPIEVSVAFCAIDDDTMQEVDAERLRVHFFGVIRYRDVFGASRKTTFRYIWKPEIREPVPQEEGQTFVAEEAGWEISGKPKDNRAT